MNPASNLKAMYADFSVMVTHTARGTTNATQGRAFHKQPGEYILGSDVIGTNHTLRFRADVFPAVRKGDSFQIGEVVFKAAENARPTADGSEMTVVLERS